MVISKGPPVCMGLYCTTQPYRYRTTANIGYSNIYTTIYIYMGLVENSIFMLTGYGGVITMKCNYPQEFIFRESALKHRYIVRRANIFPHTAAYNVTVGGRHDLYMADTQLKNYHKQHALGQKTHRKATCTCIHISTPWWGGCHGSQVRGDHTH